MDGYASRVGKRGGQVRDQVAAIHAVGRLCTILVGWFGLQARVRAFNGPGVSLLMAIFFLTSCRAPTQKRPSVQMPVTLDTQAHHEPRAIARMAERMGDYGWPLTQVRLHNEKAWPQRPWYVDPGGPFKKTHVVAELSADGSLWIRIEAFSYATTIVIWPTPEGVGANARVCYIFDSGTIELPSHGCWNILSGDIYVVDSPWPPQPPVTVHYSLVGRRGDGGDVELVQGMVLLDEWILKSSE